MMLIKDKQSGLNIFVLFMSFEFIIIQFAGIVGKPFWGFQYFNKKYAINKITTLHADIILIHAEVVILDPPFFVYDIKKSR